MKPFVLVGKIAAIQAFLRAMIRAERREKNGTARN